MPDFFRGKPATESMLGNRDELMAWIQKEGTIDVVGFRYFKLELDSVEGKMNFVF